MQQESLGYCPGSECPLPPRCLQQVWGRGNVGLAGVCVGLAVSLLAGQLGSTCCGTPSSTLAAGRTLCSGQASCASWRVALSQGCVAFAEGTDDVPSWPSTQVPG